MGMGSSSGYGFPLIIFVLVTACACPAPSGASELFDEALYQANQGHLEHAVDLWTRFIKRHPQSYAAYANRGTAHLWTGHVYKGIMDWHRARELSPLFAYAVYNARFIPDTEQNSTMLNYAIPLELEPDYYPSVHMTGSLLQDIGRTDKAIIIFRKSIDLTRNPLLKSHLEYWATSLESKSPQ